MTGGETPAEGFQLREDLARELILPDVPYRPMGSEDGLSEYIYRPMISREDAVPIVALIDFAGTSVDPADFGDVTEELHEQKVARLHALLIDMPEDIPFDVRLSAWEYAFNADWMQRFARDGKLEKSLLDVADRDPDLSSALIGVLQRIIQEKQLRMTLLVREDPAVPILAGTAQVDFMEVLDGFGIVREKYGNEALAVYDALVKLTRADERAFRR